MRDITQSVLVWVGCCIEVWDRWFKDLENGEDEFGEVEQALFSALVLSSINVANRPDLDTCFEMMSAVYDVEIADYRAVCRKQKAGTIYCESIFQTFDRGTVLPVKSIDFMGRMLNGSPYAELRIDSQHFLLEPIENLIIKIDL